MTISLNRRFDSPIAGKRKQNGLLTLALNRRVRKSIALLRKLRTRLRLPHCALSTWVNGRVIMPPSTMTSAVSLGDNIRTTAVNSDLIEANAAKQIITSFELKCLHPLPITRKRAGIPILAMYVTKFCASVRENINKNYSPRRQARLRVPDEARQIATRTRDKQKNTYVLFLLFVDERSHHECRSWRGLLHDLGNLSR